MHTHCCVRSSKYRPVTHVIFDLDGTIVDSEPVYQKALKQAIEDYECEFSLDIFMKVQGSPQRELARVVIDALGLDTTIEEFLEKFLGHSDKHLQDLELMPGAERMIRHLHKNNIPIAVATSSTQESFNLKTKKYEELFNCFHHIVCGGTDPEVKKGKPEPDIFLIAASRFDDAPDPSKCLVFEDSTNGLKAGLAAGMQVVMIPEPITPYDSWKLATLRLDSFNYMIPELFGLPSFPEDEISQEFARLNLPPEEKPDSTNKEAEKKEIAETEQEKLEGEITGNDSEEAIEKVVEESPAEGNDKVPENAEGEEKGIEDAMRGFIEESVEPSVEPNEEKPEEENPKNEDTAENEEG